MENNLWSQDTLNENKIEEAQPTLSLGYYSDVKTLEKCQSFDLTSSQTMEIMSGMTPVYGAAAYLSDTVGSEFEVNVELVYTTTSYIDRITKDTLLDYPEQCARDDYSHVVTSTTFGCTVVFVFKYMADSGEDMNMVGAELEQIVRLIPSFSVTGGGSADLSEHQRNILDQSNLRMYANLDSEITLPTDFDSAVQFFSLLPEIANNNPTIIEARLTPLSHVCFDNNAIFNSISDQLVHKITTTLDEMEMLDTNIKTLFLADCSQMFAAEMKNLQHYENALKMFTDSLLITLNNIIPNVRGGTSHEDDLLEILFEVTKSPFDYEISRQFLLFRLREINSITSLTQSFPEESNIGLFDPSSGSDIDFFLKFEDVLIVTLNMIAPQSLIQSFLDGEIIDESDSWFNDIASLSQVGGFLHEFTEFAVRNKGDEERGYILQVSILENNDELTTMEGFHLGQFITNTFEFPTAPDKPYPSTILSAFFTFKVKKMDQFTLGIMCTLTDLSVVDEPFIERYFPISSSVAAGDDVKFTFNGIQQQHNYSFHVAYVTQFGGGPTSEESESFHS